MTLEDPSAGWEMGVPAREDVGAEVWIPKDCCLEGAEDGRDKEPVGAPLAAAFAAAGEGLDLVGDNIVDNWGDS